MYQHSFARSAIFGRSSSPKICYAYVCTYFKSFDRHSLSKMMVRIYISHIWFVRQRSKQYSDPTLLLYTYLLQSNIQTLLYQYECTYLINPKCSSSNFSCNSNSYINTYVCDHYKVSTLVTQNRRYGDRNVGRQVWREFLVL